MNPNRHIYISYNGDLLLSMDKIKSVVSTDGKGRNEGGIRPGVTRK